MGTISRKSWSTIAGRSCATISPRKSHDRGSIVPRSRRDRAVIAMRSNCDRAAIAVRSNCNRTAITYQPSAKPDRGLFDEDQGLSSRPRFFTVSCGLDASQPFDLKSPVQPRVARVEFRNRDHVDHDRPIVLII